MRRKITKRQIVTALVTVSLLVAAAIGLADLAVSNAGGGRVFAVVGDVPKADVALVLGTSPRFKGRPNPFYEARLDAAADLFRSGVVRGLLVSGDNSRNDYDEPTQMKADLIARGIPAEHIACDFAGFSTLDSIKRAGPVFGLNHVILVSQRFHVERALFLAKAAGLEADGFVAQDAPPQWRLRVRTREILARVKAVVDVVINRQPRFLGQREVVNLAPAPTAH